MSLVLALLTEHRLRRDCETERNHNRNPEDALDPPDPLSPLPGGDATRRAFPEPAPRPLSATTVVFSGTVVRNGERFALREMAGDVYPLDSAGRAWSWEGEDVRVTGKLDLGSRLLHVDDIESAVR